MLSYFLEVVLTVIKTDVIPNSVFSDLAVIIYSLVGVVTVLASLLEILTMGGFFTLFLKVAWNS